MLDGRAAALFGDRPVLLDAAQRGAAAGELLVIERSFTREPIALAMRRGDDAFRLLVDRTLSRLYRSPDLAPLYSTWFGEPDAGTLEFFRSSRCPTDSTEGDAACKNWAYTAKSASCAR